MLYASLKNEDTWCAVLGHYDAEFDTAVEYSKVVIVIRMASCMFLRNSDGDRYFLDLCRSDDGSWDWDYGWLDGDRIRDNVSPVSETLFISRPALLRG